MQSHLHDLRSEVPHEFAERFAHDWRTAGLDAPTLALLALAEKLTRSPDAVNRSDIAALRTHGFTDEGITRAIQVVGYFNYINRIAEGLGVAMEDWIDHQGRPL